MLREWRLNFCPVGLGTWFLVLIRDEHPGQPRPLTPFSALPKALNLDCTPIECHQSHIFLVAFQSRREGLHAMEKMSEQRPFGPRFSAGSWLLLVTASVVTGPLVQLWTSNTPEGIGVLSSLVEKYTPYTGTGTRASMISVISPHAILYEPQPWHSDQRGWRRLVHPYLYGTPGDKTSLQKHWPHIWLSRTKTRGADLHPRENSFRRT